ncbi:hypothetical protein MNBD_GAMMA21-1811 [hydrothermal vent metagenome]|uniref:Uncharacterized protein n=1 Tax=hydrothermal vent metagenome TaxID=652676 RepID=A0A3B0ZRM1_9ZZZZ
MKHFLLFIMLTASLSLSAWAGGKVYVIQTSPLTCDFCAYDLELKFMGIEGVNEFDVDIDGIFYVKTDSSLKLDEARVKSLLLENGFDFKGMTEKAE